MWPHRNSARRHRCRGPSGSLADSILLLMVADIWRDEPIVRRLYRSHSNGDTVLPEEQGQQRSAMLYYADGTATAEDELIQRLRLHFGRGTAASLDARATQNGRNYAGGVFSASFRDGHTSMMRPRICSALTDSAPGGLSVTLQGGDAALRWDAPTHDTAAVSGYRIWRGSGTADPTVHVADTGSADATWTDEGPAAGEYTYVVQALYDDYYTGRKSSKSRVTVTDPPVGAGNPVVAGQAACRYSLTSPSHRVDFAEQAPVVIGEVGATDLSAEHTELVTQDDDLEVLRAA